MASPTETRAPVASTVRKALRRYVLPIGAFLVAASCLAFAARRFHDEQVATVRSNAANELLAVTDQFRDGPVAGPSRARELLARLRDDYKRHYYDGIVHERFAVAQFRRAAPRSGEVAYAALRDAMACYERAEAMRPPGNDEAILRWNSCARMLAANPQLAPAAAEEFVPSYD